jgi:hypothetical protein
VDNLRNVEVVLASGEVLQANDKGNTHLFWAVRGINPKIQLLIQAAAAILV